MSLAEWLGIWLELYVDPTGLAENTKLMYHRAVRAVPAELGEVILDELSALECRRWLVQVAAYAPRAAQLDRCMLSRALKVASKLGLWKGIFDADTCPKIEHQARETVILPLDQLRAYMAEVCRLAGPAELGLMLCACGLRRGEARGVTWADVDLGAGTVAINGQRQQMGPKVPCKTAASVRVLKLPVCAVEALKRGRGAPLAFVCPVSESELYRAHRSIISRLRLCRVTLHGLRHSVATASVMDGAPLKAVQGYLGHANYQITADIYANHLPSIATVCEQLFA